MRGVDPGSWNRGIVQIGARSLAFGDGWGNGTTLFAARFCVPLIWVCYCFHIPFLQSLLQVPYIVSLYRTKANSFDLYISSRGEFIAFRIQVSYFHGSLYLCSNGDVKHCSGADAPDIELTLFPLALRGVRHSYADNRSLHSVPLPFITYYCHIWLCCSFAVIEI